VLKYLKREVITFLTLFCMGMSEFLSFDWLNLVLRHWIHVALFAPNIFTSQTYIHLYVCVCVFVLVCLFTWNVKIKLSESKCCPSARHECTWRGSESIASFIINFSMRRKWVGNLHPGHFFSVNISFSSTEQKTWYQSHYEHCEELKYLFLTVGPIIL
jgi:predicted membrane protein